MAKSTKKPIMSDIGLQMQETIEKVKTMKGHTAAKEKLADMEEALSFIKKAYFSIPLKKFINCSFYYFKIRNSKCKFFR